MQDSTNRMRHLDGLRIVAASAVVVLHYSDYVKELPVGRFMVDHTWHFNLFVDLFFVVSGFVIASQYLARVGTPASIGRFIWRRLARIYPLHLVTLVFYVAIALALHFDIAKTDNPARYPFSDLPAQLLLLHAIDGDRLTFNFPSWTLSAELCCYVLFPLVVLMATRQGRDHRSRCDTGARQQSLRRVRRNRTLGRLDQQGGRLQGVAWLQSGDSLPSVSPPDRAPPALAGAADSLAASVHPVRLVPSGNGRPRRDLHHRVPGDPG